MPQFTEREVQETVAKQVNLFLAPQDVQPDDATFEEMRAEQLQDMGFDQVFAVSLAGRLRGIFDMPNIITPVAEQPNVTVNQLADVITTGLRKEGRLA